MNLSNNILALVGKANKQRVKTIMQQNRIWSALQLKGFKQKKLLKHCSLSRKTKQSKKIITINNTPTHSILRLYLGIMVEMAEILGEGAP